MNRLLLFLFFLSPIFSRAQTTFSKVFSDPTGATIGGFAVVQTPDNGFMIAGNNIYGGDGGLVMKLDSTGGQVWKKYYNMGGGGLQTGLFCIAPTNDSCYLAAGAGSNSLDAYIFCMKINQVGDTLWTRKVQTPKISQIFSSQQTYDNGYIMAGLYRSTTAPYTRLAIVKLDSVGNLQWDKVVTASGYENDPCTVKQTPDSAYVICGTLSQYSYSYLIKISPTGTVLWSKKYNRPTLVQMTGRSLEIVNDGLISVLTGSANSYIILMKTDFDGNIIWSKTGWILDGTTEAYLSKIHKTKDGGFIITIGYPQQYGPGYVWRTDSLGNELWSRQVGNNTVDAIETSDNGAFILGLGPCYGVTIEDTRHADPPLGGQIGVVKTDSVGYEFYCTGQSWGGFGTTDSLIAANFTTTASTIGPTTHVNITIVTPVISESNGCVTFTNDVNEISNSNSLTITPNPTHNTFTIESQFQNAELKIYDLTGREVFTTTLASTGSATEVTLNPNLSCGVYFVKVTDVADSPGRGEKTFTQKLVIQ